MDNSNKKTGLIMEGGAMRGMFTAGVMDVFMENDIHFDGAAGISAGAIFGCNYKSHQIGRTIRYNKKYGRDPRYCSIWSLIKTGDLYGVDFCYHTVPEKLDIFDQKTFENSPMEFHVGATEVSSGKIEFHNCKDGKAKDVEWMRASASMPFVSRPVKIDGKLYLDGGITDPVPYKYMESIGYNRNVIILTQPKGYQKKDHHNSKLIKMLLRKYPAVAEAMIERPAVYNRQMEEILKREENGQSIVIRPPESLGISRTENDPSELEWVYQTGRVEAKKRLEEVMDFLGK
ncbi:patatin-like phospholipase family protein [Butyrivibrio sp. VCD2006]|uniref:patatin-like phospholipase family protein n=1 Tax=Butyrivibrio sp. VCD2006 TaxID=1280664 RepID=UPI0003F8D13D|nr:patatin family protein [Butyrivibrio sp. VCD2006]